MRSLELTALIVPASLMLAACAEPQTQGASGGTGEQSYEANTMILESPDHGPELCLGGVADSLPPQCGGVPISNWDWRLVDGEESMSGTTWGEFRVVGTYDGDRFAVVETGAYRPPAPSAIDFTPPCPEPDGGWASSDPGRATDADLQAVMREAERQPDAAGFWIDYVGEPSETAPPGGIVAVAAFTGDLERHEAELRDVWSGPLCVVELRRTSEELRRIQRELGSEVGRELGLQVTWSATSVVENLVEIGVVVAGDDLRRAVDERYGPGAVRLVPGLVLVG